MSPATDRLLEIARYIEQLCVAQPPAFTQALRDAAAAGLPPIHVSPNEGKLLYLLAQIAGAQRILEIGLLGGYSALWLASALPANGRMVTLEINDQYAGVGRHNLERAGLGARVDIRVGPAAGSLQRMIHDAEPAFDLIFIDADKEGYPLYLDGALQLVRPGGLILADNVIRNGQVTDATPADASIRAIREFNRKLAGDPRLEVILLPIMREAIDGLAIARLKQP